ncbi:MAG: TIGR03960 family B12-binding radical SAM protein [Defluviitaleaceae bacterium]|nr:TIGR03960 family B12-binding radical SAM protein [Defluviitaleaceae bacterium]
MSRKQLKDSDLVRVVKPGCYSGGEFNAVYKQPENLTRFAFCFPDTYEVGMSHLGLQILYFFLNKREDTWCERAFMPWVDMIDLLKEKDVPLFAIESGDGLRDFDILGFTLQYEMSYTNVLAMLDLAGVPLLANERGEEWPLVCAGGPCATNPEPMADFVDFYYIGDGEAALDTVLDMYGEYKAGRLSAQEGSDDRVLTKADFLASICHIPGIYVPQFYDVAYNDDGTLAGFKPNHPAAPEMVSRAFSTSLGFFPDRFIVPLTEAVHNRAVVEIARGCMRGCRFCQAGYIYRPLRERTLPEILANAEALLDSTGHDEISLLALSACDHENFAMIIDELLEHTAKRRVNISLPSTRIDAVSLTALAKTQAVRKSSLTVAPEAGSQKMRDIINKNLSEEDILEGCYLAFQAGFDKIKLYFMAGLPGEEEEDVLAIAALAEKVVDTYYRLDYEARKRPVSVSVSTACFVPKPFTPFQWAAMAYPGDFAEDQHAVKSRIRKKQISYRYHDAKTAQVEGVLARGDRRLGRAVLAAYRAGAVFDGWSERFRYDIWLSAFAQEGIDPAFYAHRERPVDEKLPWDFINMGVSKKFLLREWENAQAGKTTPNCRDGCAGCGCKCV